MDPFNLSGKVGRKPAIWYGNGLTSDQQLDMPVFAARIHQEVVKAARQGVSPLVRQGNGQVLARLDLVEGQAVHHAESGGIDPYPHIRNRAQGDTHINRARAGNGIWIDDRGPVRVGSEAMGGQRREA